MRAMACLLLAIPSLALAQIDTPKQRNAKFESFCASQPPELRAECREQARAASQEYNANYQAMKQREFEEKQRRARER